MKRSTTTYSTRNTVPLDGAHRQWKYPLANEIDRLLAAGQTPLLDGLVRSFEAVAICRALAFTGGNRSHAARLLGIGRNTISRKINELGLEEY